MPYPPDTSRRQRNIRLLSPSPLQAGPPEETRTSFPAHPKTSKLRHTFYEFIGPLLRTAEDVPTIQ